jgi:L-alanine-DL-glutamate epimerase-like enolase superfamily enzyme
LQQYFAHLAVSVRVRVAAGSSECRRVRECRRVSECRRGRVCAAAVTHTCGARRAARAAQHIHTPHVRVAPARRNARHIHTHKHTHTHTQHKTHTQSTHANIARRTTPATPACAPRARRCPPPRASATCWARWQRRTCW